MGPGDNKRAIGRGVQYSAGHRRAEAMKHIVEGTDYSMPLRQHIEDGLDTHGLHMASTSAPIPPDNKGYMLLQKMGWKGAGLGKSGRTAPIDVNALDAGLRLGLGKQEQDALYTAAENVNRKTLEIEREVEETEEQRERRLRRAEEQTRIEADVKQMKRTFYCEVCDKQYVSVAQLEEHLSSYDHHHRKRLKEVKQMELSRTRDARERKEQKRAAKEMARLGRQIAAVAGTQAAPSSAPPLPPPNSASAPPLPNDHASSGWSNAAPPMPSANAAAVSGVGSGTSRWGVGALPAAAQPPLPPHPSASGLAPGGARRAFSSAPPLPADDGGAPPLPPGTPPSSFLSQRAESFVPGPCSDKQSGAAGKRASGPMGSQFGVGGSVGGGLRFGVSSVGPGASSGGGLQFGIASGAGSAGRKGLAFGAAAGQPKRSKVASLFGHESDEDPG